MKRYKYPELLTYKKEWIPFLEQVKLAISSRKATFICFAIEDLMIATPCQELQELQHEILLSLGGVSTVTLWFYWNNGEEALSRGARQCRLEWLDRIIKRCKSA